VCEFPVIDRFRLARRGRTHREYWTEIADNYIDNRFAPGPDTTGLRVIERV
jgi:hypothetical protein